LIAIRLRATVLSFRQLPAWTDRDPATKINGSSDHHRTGGRRRMTVSDATHSRTWGVDGLKGWRNRCHPVRCRYQALIRVHCARSNRLGRGSATPTSAREGGDPESQDPLKSFDFGQSSRTRNLGFGGKRNFDWHRSESQRPSLLQSVAVPFPGISTFCGDGIKRPLSAVVTGTNSYVFRQTLRVPKTHTLSRTRASFANRGKNALRAAA
jgi:hypothetical protein